MFTVRGSAKMADKGTIIKAHTQENCVKTHFFA